MGPAQFSTGLVADLYGPLRGHVYDDPERTRHVRVGPRGRQRCARERCSVGVVK
ncbi:MAG: hypothetical protein JJT89_08805 [Nitriliruptoraceae bacterium]|nr:hypothetical protein [Nitriliruptoraceae bacterium]